MQLPPSVNERFGRIASVAQGARADGWQKLLPLAVSALLVRPARLAAGAACLDPARGGSGAAAAGARLLPPSRRPRPAAVDVGCDRQRPPVRRGQCPGGRLDRPERRGGLADAAGAGRHHRQHRSRRSGTPSSARTPTSAKVYAVGKTITGGTKLHSVYPDRAILDRGGKLEALLLPKKFQGGGMSAGAAGRRRPGRPDARRPAARAGRDQPGGHHGHPAAAARLRQRPAARLPDLPGPQPRPVQPARAAAGRPGHGHQRHAARRRVARHGDPADHEHGLERSP